MFGGQVAFLSPLVLALLAVLPLLWWLLRLTPPAPRKLTFPALELLRGLAVPEQTPARTPWWLLLLRLAIAALIILAFAQPVIDPEAVTAGRGPLLIAVDNDWASARDWENVQKELQGLVREAARENRDVILLPTAPSENGGEMQPIGPLDAKGAYAEADRIAPEPWGADWVQATSLLPKIDTHEAVWLASGIGGIDAKLFYQALREKGARRALGDMADPIYLLQPPQPEGDGIALPVMRAQTDDAASVSVAAVGSGGGQLAHGEAAFSQGAPRAMVAFHLPLEIRNQVARFEIAGRRGAGGVILLDSSWSRHPVGLVGDPAELAQHSLLSGLFYIDRALKPYADLHVDTLDTLLQSDISVLILTDAAEVKDAQVAALLEWIKRGGILVRFAGDRLAGEDKTAPAKEDELLPVELRGGDRALGGTLSWSTPQKLQEFPASSPFKGLEIPGDVTVSRQILAEPSGDLAKSTWASLADGTPLVTAKNMGSGLSVLFHVPAQSSWSNLPLSGLFVDMLRRIIDLSQGAAGAENFESLPPYLTLNGFGETEKADGSAQPLEGKDLARIKPSPQHPPGLYGSEAFSRAFNLGDALTQPEKLAGVPLESWKPNEGQLELQPWLLTLSFVLFLADFVLGLYLRGLTFNLRRKAAALLLFFFLIPAPAHAAENVEKDAKAAVELTSKTYLAYVMTGNRETDHISEAGLAGLAQVLQRRTSIDQIAVTGVDPENDELAFFPFLYWPVVPGAAPLSAKGAQHVDDYLHHGGMILFDTLTGETPSPLVVRKALDGIDIPPLEPLPQDHVLKHSYYLLDDFPGRYANPDFWVEPSTISTYDGVASVLMGSNGWAAAWAVDANGRPLFPCTPGGEPQRERAYRFGVNLTMYALTGNYKSDQLHAQELLKRMGK